MLPDLLTPGLRVVFCGTAVATASAAAGHYYAGPRQAFWQLLHESGFTPTRLRPQEDVLLSTHGIGLTDLVKTLAQSHDRGLNGLYDVDGFRVRIEAARPGWIAFHGKEAAKAYLGVRRGVAYGRQSWAVGDRPVFVLPSGSGAAQRRSYDGRLSRLDWWRDLALLVLDAP